MKKKILIPNIKKKIERKIKELGFKPKISPSQFFKIHGQNKHRYFSPVETQKGKLVAFYARCHNNIDAKEKFIREAKFLRQIQESNSPIKRVIPKILNWNKEKDFEWMFREYITGTPMGHSRKITLAPTKKQIKELTTLIPKISRIPSSSFSGSKLKKFNCQNYLTENLYVSFLKRGIISQVIEEKLVKIIKETMPLLKKENHYLAQGDLNLGNIIIDKKNNVWIIDWELVHINNFAYDIGYLWAHLWGVKKELRKKLISEYLKNLNKEQLLKFKKLLPIVASYLSLGGIQIKHTKESKENFKKRRRFYTNLLTNCTKKFEELIKT